MYYILKHGMILVDENLRIKLDGLEFIINNEEIEDDRLFYEKSLVYFKNAAIVRYNSKIEFEEKKDSGALLGKINRGK